MAADFWVLVLAPLCAGTLWLMISVVVAGVMELASVFVMPESLDS
jgi:hypothetical protein